LISEARDIACAFRATDPFTRCTWALHAARTPHGARDRETCSAGPEIDRALRRH